MILRSLFILLLTAIVCHPSLVEAARKPNIILIMADDFGYECVAANGGESYQTPNLDKLAAGGVRFENCYVQPLCTPTRVQLMTGMYNSRNYTRFAAIDPNVTTFGSLLKRAGYATGVAGKWQLGRDKNLPKRLGFDESCLWQHTRRPARFANAGLEYNGRERDFTNGEYGPDLVNEFAIDFITRHKDEPFFLYYPMILTHGPFPPTPDSPDYKRNAKNDRDGNDPASHFDDMVAYMDKLVGKVLAKLDELELRDETLVIFLGDNGTGREITSQFKGKVYPGGKGLTNYRGTHVPLIVSWPGSIPGNCVSSELIDSADFLPTLCEAAGAEVPPSLPIDGASFLPQLRGEKGKPREWLYAWYAKQGGPRATHEWAMTTELKVYSDGKIYDLRTDREESRPVDPASLSAEDAATIRKLQAVINKYANARPAELLASSGGNAEDEDYAKKEPGKKQAGKRQGKNKQGQRKNRKAQQL
jgi:arylsulfatase A